MIYQTFLHLPGVDQAQERRFWEAGVDSWWEFLRVLRFPGLSPRMLALLKGQIEEHLKHYDDLHYLAELFPARHHWRLYPLLVNKAVFFDLETNGLAKERSQITVLGIYNGSYRAYVAGEDLEEGISLLAQSPFVVTFGGTNFDLPFLKAKYPWFPTPKVHLDLCPLLRRLGLRGGLKRVEKLLGLNRPEEIDGLDGYQAVKLWRRYKRGEPKALELLIDYNREDVLNLPFLAKIAFYGLRYLTLTGQQPTLTVSTGA